jgi:hypothetical protein
MDSRQIQSFNCYQETMNRVQPHVFVGLGTIEGLSFGWRDKHHPAEELLPTKYQLNDI